jgi:hypothetical protein
MSRFILIVFYWCVVTGVFGQPVPLTPAQMREDFDFLQSQINTYCFFLPLLEQRTNTSVNRELQRLKQAITPAATVEDFAHIVRQALNILRDGHTQIVGSAPVKWFAANSYLSPVSNVTLADTLHADYYRALIDNIIPMAQSGMRVKYMNGRYYNARPFTFNNVPIRLGEEITSVDGIEIHQFIQAHSLQIYCLWDADNKQFYADNFIWYLPLIGKNVFTLTIGGKDVVVNSQKLLDNLQREKYSLARARRVEIINDSLLYICMPMMTDAAWYINALKEKYTPAVKKIIFDICSNGGGDDSVWADLLTHIIAEPFHYNFVVGMNYDERLKKAIHDFGEITVEGEKMIVSSYRTLYPDSSSVHFAGKMYILQDKYTYSAAAAFSAAAMQHKDKITVAGEPSAFIAGYTFPPVILKLPHSGLVFKLAFSADLSGGKDNPYMDKVDVELQETIDDYFDKLYSYDSSGVEYLTKTLQQCEILFIFDARNKDLRL